MTIFRSELRRSVRFAELSATAFAPDDPDSICFSLGTGGEEELVQLECLSSGLKRILVQDSPSNRVVVDPTSEAFNSWSAGLQRKVADTLAELSDWEGKLRKRGNAWDIRLLADPDLSYDTLIDGDKEPS